MLLVGPDLPATLSEDALVGLSRFVVRLGPGYRVPDPT
jgi:hypothetical protein